jgi:hypothetical protein
MDNKEKLKTIYASLRGEGYFEAEEIIDDIKRIDARHQLLRDAIEHIQGTEEKGSFYRESRAQNLSWARDRIQAYGSEVLHISLY